MWIQINYNRIVSNEVMNLYVHYLLLKYAAFGIIIYWIRANPPTILQYG